MTRKEKLILCFAVLLVPFVSGESYIPKYVEGTPTEGSIVRMAPPDLRKEDLYRIEHKVLFTSLRYMMFRYNVEKGAVSLLF